MGEIHIHLHGRTADARTTDPGIKKTMHEFKRGKLHSGSKRGPVVRSRKQAIAIGLSKQRRGDAKDDLDLSRISTDSKDYGTSQGARKAAQTRKLGGGPAQTHQAQRPLHIVQQANAYPHSASTHKALAAYHEQRAAHFRGQGLHGAAAQHQHMVGVHRKAAGMKLNTPAGRKFSANAHATAARNRLD